LLALLALTAVAGGSAASTPEELTEGTFVNTDWKPGFLRSGPTNVVVQLAGDPVTVQEDTAARHFGAAEKQAAAAALAARQDAIRPSIEALGGTVVGDYQLAYNGLKVNIDARQLGAVAALPNVVGVHKLQKMEPVRPENVNGVQLIGAPAAWASAGKYTGKGIKVAVIDTGIDYTHADFGGPGTLAAYAAANATDTLPANPMWFGPNAFTKVKGGTDLVGDNYNADGTGAELIPVPDPNPLDCNGHGTHVAGSAVGYGVLSDGSTYTGPYNASTYSNTFRIGPGSAPEAELYGVRVFGCEGSTDVTVDAIEWAVENEMDVINMSLGSAFGRSDDPSAVASTNAAKTGMIVVTSAGNSGPSQYITGSPGTATGAISTAANDANQSFPGANIALNTGTSAQAINANGVPNSAFPPANTPIVVVREASGAISRGCEGIGAGGAPVPGSAPGEFAAAGAAGKIAVVIRGDCARVAKAINGQKAGAVAVIMINNAASLPPFEGQITSNPDTGEPYTVTIPFLGVSSADTSKFTAAGVSTATITPVNLNNSNYTGFASFSSGGPTNGTSDLKPDITAPGTSVISAGNGTGNGAAIISGTSMASPHVAGVAALVKQAHGDWDKVRGEDLKAAIVNTGNPAGVLNNRISRGGTGLVQPFAATQTQAVAIGDRLTGSLSYGFEELAGDFSGKKSIEVRNFGTSAITFAVGTANAAGSPHSVAFDQSSVTVPAGGKQLLKVTLNVPVATAGNADAFREVAGYVTLTPGAGQNNGVVLRVPYYLVPRALSSVKTGFTSPKKGATSATFPVSNGGPIEGSADFYTFGIESENNKANRSSADVRAVGVQSFPSGANRLLVFAVNTYDRWSHPSLNEFDVLVDVDNNGSVDYVVVGVDQGALAGSFNGTYVSAVFSTRSAGASIAFLSFAPTNGSTALMPALSTQLCRTGEPCLNAANPRFTYRIAAFDLEDSSGDDFPAETAKFNAWSPSIESGQFETIAPGATVNVTAAINRTEYALTPAKGLMAVITDNAAGRDEAELVLLKVR
jgi:subtilisin family serine protease